jgi:hypothetical protein
VSDEDTLVEDTRASVIVSDDEAEFYVPEIRDVSTEVSDEAEYYVPEIRDVSTEVSDEAEYSSDEGEPEIRD